MKDTKKISVIIPFYNSKGYAKRLIDSILGQTYSNVEIVAIDDGSTDGTGDILADYAANDKRLLHIRQPNSGAGVASNKGIDIASGDYLTFADHDDWVEPATYEKLLNALEKNEADMSVCNFNLVYNDHAENCYATMRDEVENIYDDVYGYFCKHCACPKPNNYTWTRLYKANLLKNSGIRFENFRLGSDTLLNFKLLPFLNRVAFINEGLYNYVQYSNSTVHRAAEIENLAIVYADGFDSLANYYNDNGHKEFLSVLPIHAFTRLRSVYFYSRLAGLGDDVIAENVRVGFKGRQIAKYLTGGC